MKRDEERSVLREVSRELFLSAWQKVRRGMEAVSEDEKSMVEAIREHPEYWEELGSLQNLTTADWDSLSVKQGEVVRHLIIEASVISQLEDSPAVRGFYESMESKGAHPHHIRHMIGMIFIGEFRLAQHLLRQGKKPDPGRYDKLLTELSKVSPEGFREKLAAKYPRFED